MTEKDPDPRAGDSKHSKTVKDEEGTVDSRIKQRILNTRDRVNRAEEQLFIEPNQLTHRARLEKWTTVIRQYIRDIKPLLESDQIRSGERYQSEVKIADFQVAPPNGDYPWAEIVNSSQSADQIRTTYGLHPQTELPNKKRVQRYGLESLLDRPQIHKTWTIKMFAGGGATNNTHTVTLSRPFQKPILEGAITHTDKFLQEIGIGVDIGHREVDDTDDNPF